MLPWLGRYASPEPLRVEGAFLRFSTRRERDAKACVVVVPSPLADADQARGALMQLVAGHASIAHPLVPAAELVDTREGPIAELDCGAVIDGAELVARCVAARRALALGEVDALVGALRELAAARPVARLSLESLLVSVEGRVWLLGLGHDVANLDERGRCATTRAVFPPFGARDDAPTAVGAIAACWGLYRALLEHTMSSPRVEEALRGVAGSPLAALEGAIARGDAAAADACFDAVREALGARPDPDGLTRTLSDVALGLGGPSDDPQETTEESVAIARDGAWIEPRGGPRVELGPSLRRIVALLVARAAGAAPTVSAWELLDAGWPDETVAPEAGLNRVYAAVRRLRNMGLRGILAQGEQGYRLGPPGALTIID